MELCVIEGDGVGREVVPAAVQIVRKVLPDVQIHTARAGWEAFQQLGTPLPEETIDIARSSGAVLFGAAHTPAFPVEGYFSPILQLRQILKAHANIRPVTYWPVPTARAGVDVIVVRENTEDVYGYGLEERSMTDGGETGTAKKIITRAATERIAHTCFRLARLAGRELVTIVHKGNVLPQTDGLFRRVAFEVAAQYPDIETDELLVDTAAYWMVKEPTRFDIILTANQYGDILSDMAAAWGGGKGFVPSLSIGDEIGIAEPTHGPAPDIAGKGIANPVASILSMALLTRYRWRLPEIADRIENAVRETLKAGLYTPDVRPNDTLNTVEFTAAVIKRL